MNDTMHQTIDDNRDLIKRINENECNINNKLYLRNESQNKDPSMVRSVAEMKPELHCYGTHHIPFKTAKWQEWWGELYYRRDGNDTPKSLAPEVAELQDLFAEVKRRHQENHRLWRHDLTKYLLRMEEMSPNPLTLSEEYQRIRDSFEIPFETVDYQNWWKLGSGSGLQYCVHVDDRYMPCCVFSPFEKFFVVLAHKIHVATYERHLDEARRLISELSTVVDEDRLSIANSIASGVLSSTRL